MFLRRRSHPQFARFQLEQSNRKLPRGLSVRLAEPADARAVARISYENRGGDYGAMERRVVREIAGEWEGTMLLVAVVGRRVLGFARVSYFEPEADAPANVCPEGWYLLGVVIRPRFRRRGIARVLTAARLRTIAERADEVYYFAHEDNLASIRMHESFGFTERSRDFSYPRVTFRGGTGVLFRAELAAAVVERMSGCQRHEQGG